MILATIFFNTIHTDLPDEPRSPYALPFRHGRELVAVLSLVMEPGVDASITDGGLWESQYTRLADALNRFFGPGYTPTDAYCALGREVAVARDVAWALHGEIVEYADPATLGRDDVA